MTNTESRWGKLLKSGKKGQEVYFDNQFWNLKSKQGRSLVLTNNYEEIKVFISRDGYAQRK